ncbi:hypothetical protein BDFB_013802 [Asbolus verrucosus]|uniref:Uncharacterized protein n=1 Tax=Asbolus verrucosus TaxID=1661398 RepID=A0A482VKB8_ASBVE|nr:hypothetical protein BDFB_013802 [Asbolus verrucosus]
MKLGPLKNVRKQVAQELSSKGKIDF